MNWTFPMVGCGCFVFWLLCTIGNLGCQVAKTIPSIGSLSLIRPFSDTRIGLPFSFKTRRGNFLIFRDDDFQGDQSILDSVENLHLELARELGIVPHQKWVKVYIFSDNNSFRNYLDSTFPGLPKRKAYFFARKRGAGLGEELQVLTLRSDRLLQDLRHEVTHALLHCAFGLVPLWIDEGIAEYFENEPNCLGFNRAHWDDIQVDWVGGRIPNLKRLDSLTSVGQMGREEYRESWAWVYWLIRLHPGGKDMIKAYLADKMKASDSIGFAQLLESQQSNFAFQMMEEMSRVGISESKDSGSKGAGPLP